MAKTNDIIENPVVGEKAKFLITSEDSKGEILKFQVTDVVGAAGPPMHWHPEQSENFEVISGTVTLTVNGKTQVLTAGQKASIQKNDIHTYRNTGNTEMVMNIELLPALRTEFFLETMFALAKKGDCKPDSVPKDFFQFMAILNEYYGELFIVGPPLLAQKIMAKVVGRFAKLLGYKGFIKYQAI
jgi:quercetin dioxygenase-like cupin family protein